MTDEKELFFNRTLKFIENDIIVELKNHKLAKWCRPLNCVAYYDIPKENYIKYYKNQFHDKKYQNLIEEACLEKLKNGLTNKDLFRNLVENGNDYIFYKTTRSTDNKKSIQIKTSEKNIVLKLL